MYSLVGRNFRFDAETEKAYKAWLDGDSRHLFRVAMIFGIAAYAVNYAGDYAISGADIASLFLVRLSIVSTIALTLGVTYFFRDFSPAWAGIALAAITSSANTAIMHFMPDSATFWLPAAQSITALVFVLIVTRYEALIIIAVIMFAVPVSWNFLAADHSSLAAPQAILLATTVAAMALLGHYIDRGKRTIFKLSRDLFYAATHDALTGIFNRSRVLETLDHEVTMFRRFKQPFALVCIDVDRFKSINDTYSHLAGDAVLKAITNCLTDEIRESDIVGRIGGEEFLIVLPNTKLAAASDMAERLRRAVEALIVPWQGQSIYCTISCGVAQCMRSDDAFSLMARVDLALYRAKENGRNRIETRAKPVKSIAAA